VITQPLTLKLAVVEGLQTQMSRLLAAAELALAGDVAATKSEDAAEAEAEAEAAQQSPPPKESPKLKLKLRAKVASAS
jgi:hypothetical protein